MAEQNADDHGAQDFRALYQLAFEIHGAAALWNKARLEMPTPDHALVIAQSLRLHGNREARRLAEDLELAAKHAQHQRGSAQLQGCNHGSRV